MERKHLKVFSPGRLWLWAAVALLWGVGMAPAKAQSFQIDPEKPATVSVDGSSTLHNWTATCGVVEGYPATLNLKVADGAAIESFAFSVQVKSMAGGRGSTMDGKIFAALKAEEHPHIKYRQTSPARLTNVGADGSFKLVSKGLLQMAGVEKEVSVNVSGQLKDGQLVLSGSHPMKMSDFQIEKPSAMFGQIQTTDDITVNFTFRYRSK